MIYVSTYWRRSGVQSKDSAGEAAKSNNEKLKPPQDCALTGHSGVKASKGRDKIEGTNNDRDR